MKESAQYIKIVEWSEEDQCFIGQCPGIIGPCCHGDNEIEVYKELCLIVEEWLEISKKENKALPSPTIGKGIAERFIKLQKSKNTGRNEMKIAYSSDVDILYIRFNESKIEESDEEKPGIIFDYDKDGNVVGLEIQDASKKMVLPVTIDYALAG